MNSTPRIPLVQSIRYLRAKRTLKLPRRPVPTVIRDSRGEVFEFKHGPPPASNYRLKLLGWRMRTINMGCGNRPFFLIVIQRQREENYDEYTEQVGSYDPIPNRQSDLLVGLNVDRIRYWLGKGAEPTKTV